MSTKIILLALFLASLVASLPVHRPSLNISITTLNSTAPEISNSTLTKRTTANPPFDPYIKAGYRADGDDSGDVYRLSKCYCVDTPSKDLPPVYGQFYGSYYGFDYYNHHLDQSVSVSWTCASGELETLNWWRHPTYEHTYWLAPKCLSWMEEDREKECWDAGNGNEFCVEIKHGKDYYYWNGQKRMVHNHPPAKGTTGIMGPQLDEECQRMCQTVPANTAGFMQDTILSDRDHKINLATETPCSSKSGVSMGMCDYKGVNETQTWDYWNYIETYTDQADMCKECQ